MADVDTHIMPGITHWQHPRCASYSSAVVVAAVSIVWEPVYRVRTACRKEYHCTPYQLLPALRKHVQLSS